MIELTPMVRSLSPKFRKSYALASDHEFSGTEFKIPAGYEFDGASIPPVLWAIIGEPFDPRFVRAAIHHDYAYSTHLIPRDVADSDFKRLLIEDGVSKFRAMLMHAAVRVAGATSWETSEDDAAYIEYLKREILSSGRDLKEYGL